jgi:hypothetical protein
VGRGPDEGKSATPASDYRAKQIDVLGVLSAQAVLGERGLRRVPHLLRDQGEFGNLHGDDFAKSDWLFPFVDPPSVLEFASVNGTHDQVSNVARSPDALGVLPALALTGAFRRRGNAEPVKPSETVSLR